MTTLKKRIAALGIVLTVIMELGVVMNGSVSAFATIPESSEAEVQTNVMENEVIVMYKGTSAMQSATFSRAMQVDVEVVQSYTFDTTGDASLHSQAQGVCVPDSGFVVSLVHSDTLSTEELMTRLQTQPNVLGVQPNHIIQVQSYEQDPYADYQWALQNTGQNGGTVGNDINADSPSVIISPDAGEQVIAVVDTGIDYTHPDLKDCMWENSYQETGQLGGAHGYNFSYMTDDPMDDNGHGSHCAGIIAASIDNEEGIAGTVSGENVKLMALKIMDADGYGSDFAEVGAYHYIYQAQQLGVNVVAVNNSWGYAAMEQEFYEDEIKGFSVFKTLVNLVGENGALSLIASGNESVDCDVYNVFPANLNSPYIVSVAASDEQDRLAIFSNYGNKSVDIAAPGVSILSTVAEPTLQPLLMTEEQKEAYLYFYEDFSTRALVPCAEDASSLYQTDDTHLSYMTENSEETAEVTVGIDNTVYHENASENAASLHWSVSGAKAGEQYLLYLPYLAQGTDSAAYFSCDILAYNRAESESLCSSSLILAYQAKAKDGKIRKTSETFSGSAYVGNTYGYWDGVSTLLPGSETGSENVIAYMLYCQEDGDYDIYLDNFAISKDGIPESDWMVAYDFYSGTSMATPYVTGAAGVIAGMYPEADALTRKAILLGCTRPSEALTGKVATGGVLDLSYLEQPNPVLLDAQLDSEQAVLELTGSQLTETEITINDTPAEFLSLEENRATVDISAYTGKHIQLHVKAGTADYEKLLYFADGQYPPRYYFGGDTIIAGKMDKMLNTGDSLYYCSENGMVYQYYSLSEPVWNPVNENLLEEVLLTEIESLEMCEVSVYGFAAFDAQIYAAVHLDFGYMMKNVLAEYDTESGLWGLLTDVPDTFLLHDTPSFAAYQGSLYLIGGKNEQTGELYADVLRFSLEDGTWETASALPEASYGGTAQQVGEEMILTLNETASGTALSPWHFDGTAWRISSAVMPEISSLARGYQSPLCSASVSVYEDTLIYTGLPVDDMGDILQYHAGEEAFTGSEYTAYGLSWNNVYYTSVMDDVLYMTYNVGTSCDVALIPLNGEFPSEVEELGDVDFDGNITMDDAFAVLSYYARQAAGIEENYFTDGTDAFLEAAAYAAADVDADGQITMDDAFYILTFYAKKAAGIDVVWEEVLPVG